MHRLARVYRLVFCLSMVVCQLSTSSCVFAGDPPAGLTAGEVRGGWKPLFDGQTTNGWRSYRGTELNPGWKVHDGILERAEKGAETSSPRNSTAGSSWLWSIASPKGVTAVLCSA
jgi:hypothetical protein